MKQTVTPIHVDLGEIVTDFVGFGDLSSDIDIKKVHTSSCYINDLINTAPFNNINEVDFEIVRKYISQQYVQYTSVNLVSSYFMPNYLTCGCMGDKADYFLFKHTHSKVNLIVNHNNHHLYNIIENRAQIFKPLKPEMFLYPIQISFSSVVSENIKFKPSTNQIIPPILYGIISNYREMKHDQIIDISYTKSENTVIFTISYRLISKFLKFPELNTIIDSLSIPSIVFLSRKVFRTLRSHFNSLQIAYSIFHDSMLLGDNNESVEDMDTETNGQNITIKQTRSKHIALADINMPRNTGPKIKFDICNNDELFPAIGYRNKNPDNSEDENHDDYYLDKSGNKVSSFYLQFDSLEKEEFVDMCDNLIIKPENVVVFVSEQTELVLSAEFYRKVDFMKVIHQKAKFINPDSGFFKNKNAPFVTAHFAKLGNKWFLFINSSTSSFSDYYNKTMSWNDSLYDDDGPKFSWKKDKPEEWDIFPPLFKIVDYKQSLLDFCAATTEQLNCFNHYNQNYDRIFRHLKFKVGNANQRALNRLCGRFHVKLKILKCRTNFTIAVDDFETEFNNVIKEYIKRKEAKGKVMSHDQIDEIYQKSLEHRIGSTANQSVNELSEKLNKQIIASDSLCNKAVELSTANLASNKKAAKLNSDFAEGTTRAIKGIKRKFTEVDEGLLASYSNSQINASNLQNVISAMAKERNKRDHNTAKFQYLTSLRRDTITTKISEKIDVIGNIVAKNVLKNNYTPINIDTENDEEYKKGLDIQKKVHDDKGSLISKSGNKFVDYTSFKIVIQHKGELVGKQNLIEVTSLEETAELMKMFAEGTQISSPIKKKSKSQDNINKGVSLIDETSSDYINDNDNNDNDRKPMKEPCHQKISKNVGLYAQSVQKNPNELPIKRYSPNIMNENISYNTTPYRPTPYPSKIGKRKSLSDADFTDIIPNSPIKNRKINTLTLKALNNGVLDDDLVLNKDSKYYSLITDSSMSDWLSLGQNAPQNNLPQDMEYPNIVPSTDEIESESTENYSITGNKSFNFHNIKRITKNTNNKITELTSQDYEDQQNITDGPLRKENDLQPTNEDYMRINSAVRNKVIHERGVCNDNQLLIEIKERINNQTIYWNGTKQEANLNAIRARKNIETAIGGKYRVNKWGGLCVRFPLRIYLMLLQNIEEFRSGNISLPCSLAELQDITDQFRSFIITLSDPSFFIEIADINAALDLFLPIPKSVDMFEIISKGIINVLRNNLNILDIPLKSISIDKLFIMSGLQAIQKIKIDIITSSLIHNVHLNKEIEKAANLVDEQRASDKRSVIGRKKERKSPAPTPGIRSNSNSRLSDCDQSLAIEDNSITNADSLVTQNIVEVFKANEDNDQDKFKFADILHELKIEDDQDMEDRMDELALENVYTHSLSSTNININETTPIINVNEGSLQNKGGKNGSKSGAQTKFQIINTVKSILMPKRKEKKGMTFNDLNGQLNDINKQFKIGTDKLPNIDNIANFHNYKGSNSFHEIKIIRDNISNIILGLPLTDNNEIELKTISIPNVSDELHSCKINNIQISTNFQKSKNDIINNPTPGNELTTNNISNNQYLRDRICINLDADHITINKISYYIHNIQSSTTLELLFQISETNNRFLLKDQHYVNPQPFPLNCKFFGNLIDNSFSELDPIPSKMFNIKNILGTDYMDVPKRFYPKLESKFFSIGCNEYGLYLESNKTEKDNIDKIRGIFQFRDRINSNKNSKINKKVSKKYEERNKKVTVPGRALIDDKLWVININMGTLKMGKIYSLLQLHPNCKILCLNECNVNIKFIEDFSILGWKIFYNTKCNKELVLTAIMVVDYLSTLFTTVPTDTHDTLIKFDDGKSKFSIINIYRPHEKSVKYTNSSAQAYFDKLILTINKLQKSSIIVGDLNLQLLKPRNNCEMENS